MQKTSVNIWKWNMSSLTILSASIPKYVTDINGCSVQAFPGATIGRLSNLVANGTVNLKHIDFLIIHVGSNNIAYTNL
jgi:hypothetical protein